MSATDGPMAHSTRLMLAAGASGGLGYLHGLLGAVLAEQEIRHIGDWASGVSTLFGAGAFGLALFACMTRGAERDIAKSRLYAESVDRWERAKLAELGQGPVEQTGATPCGQDVTATTGGTHD